MLPAGADFAAPQTPAAAPASISLTALVQEIRARAATSTTRPKATTTTKKPAAPTTSTSRPVTATTKPPASVGSPTTTTASAPTPPTTLLPAVVPPAATVAAALTRSDTGVASWFNAPDATCAHRTLPFGTMVKVTRMHNGATATCKVNDRGPTLATGRLIDLSLDTFEKLAARQAGLVDVRIEW